VKRKHLFVAPYHSSTWGQRWEEEGGIVESFAVPAVKTQRFCQPRTKATRGLGRRLVCRYLHSIVDRSAKNNK
jgi:hypothetical protein